MPNTIAYSELFQKNLDLMATQQSTTGWMDANSGQVIYNGGKTIKVPKMKITGMGNYDRAKGFERGGVTLEYETMTMTQDRGNDFLLDSQDIDESNFVLSATNVMGEFQRTQVIPEVDAYRLSKIASGAITLDKNVTYSYTPEKTTIIDALKDAIAATKKAGFRNVPLCIHATTDCVNAYEKAVGAKNLSAATYAQGGLDMRAPAIDGVPIIETDDERMVSAIKIKSLADGGGFEKGSSAKAMNFVVIPMTAPIGVNKQDKMKIFDPETTQGADAWLLEYRRYHDLWVMENKLPGISANFKDAK